MNRLKVSFQQSIITLAEHGWSKRRIARELRVDRATVTRQLRANAATNSAHGSGELGPPEPATLEKIQRAKAVQAKSNV